MWLLFYPHSRRFKQAMRNVMYAKYKIIFSSTVMNNDAQSWLTAVIMLQLINENSASAKKEMMMKKKKPRLLEGNNKTKWMRVSENVFTLINSIHEIKPERGVTSWWKMLEGLLVFLQLSNSVKTLLLHWNIH